jgi:uncharacterized protein (TIGR00299 family) protein
VASRIHIHLDTVGGIAGDMFIAAMLDAVPDLVPRVMTDLSAVLPDDVGQPKLCSGEISGMAVNRFRLIEGETKQHHHREHDQANGTYVSFRERIAGSVLAEGSAQHAINILHRIAEAEAMIHNVPFDEVHFHELADWDALMDVVAAGSIIAALEGASWSVSALPLGGGLVQTAHGKLPVPAPATARILIGYDWRDDGVAGERVTPTGAAIVAHVTGGKGNGAAAGGKLTAIGNGAGTRVLDGLPNILRATLFETSIPGAEALTLISFEIDDMTGEEIATATDHLRETAGVRDVLLLAAQGKKGRPVTRVEIQAEPAMADAVARAVFLETSTLGLRRVQVHRDVLERQAEIGANGLRRKRASRPGGVGTVKVEHDDLLGLDGLATRRKAAREAEA